MKNSSLKGEVTVLAHVSIIAGAVRVLIKIRQERSQRQECKNARFLRTIVGGDGMAKRRGGQRRRTPDLCLWVFTSERQRPESISVEVDSDRVVFRPRFPVSHFLL